MPKQRAYQNLDKKDILAVFERCKWYHCTDISSRRPDTLITPTNCIVRGRPPLSNNEYDVTGMSRRPLNETAGPTTGRKEIDENRVLLSIREKGEQNQAQRAGVSSEGRTRSLRTRIGPSVRLKPILTVVLRYAERIASFTSSFSFLSHSIILPFFCWN